jgi:hypothetical protein
MAIVRWVLAGLVLALGAPTRADEPPPTAKCEVRVIQASNQGEGIDPQITRLRGYLTRAPFTAWKHFKLADSRELTVEPRAAATFPMPNGREGTLTYVDHMLRPDGKHRLRLELGVHEGDKPLMHTTFVLDEGGVVLHAAHRHAKDGVMILAVSCETH